MLVNYGHIWEKFDLSIRTCNIVPNLFSHIVIPLWQILNSITSEMLEHDGSFRTPMDQIDFIVKTLKKGYLQILFFYMKGQS